MALPTYLFRRGARYQYRRRVHHHGFVFRPITLSTRTSDLKVARARAAMLSVRFEATRAMMTAIIKSGRDVFTVREVADLYQLELEHELGAALAGYYDAAPDHDGLRRTHRVLAESYRIAGRLPGDQPVPLAAEWERLAAAGWSAKDINAVRLMIKTMCHPAHISRDLVRERLGELGLQAGLNMERDARAHIRRARLEAQERAGHFLMPAVQAAADPVAAIMRERPASMLIASRQRHRRLLRRRR